MTYRIHQLMAVAVVALLNTAPAGAQTASNGPTVDETLSWLQSNIPTLAHAEHRYDFTDVRDRFRYEAERIGRCSLRLTEIDETLDRRFRLTDRATTQITLDFAVLKGLQFQAEDYYKPGLYKVRNSLPNPYSFRMQRTTEAGLEDGPDDSPLQRVSTERLVEIWFSTKEGAIRVAKALTHAVEVCAAAQPF